MFYFVIFSFVKNVKNRDFFILSLKQYLTNRFFLSILLSPKLIPFLFLNLFFWFYTYVV